MKKLLNFALLVACFSFLASTSVSAQDFIKNGTDCKILVKVAYGPVGPSCATTGTIQMISYPGTSVSIGVPPGTEIKAAKGTYISPAANCPFYVGLPCSGLPLIDSVTCGSSCGDYKAVFVVGSGIKIYN